MAISHRIAKHASGAACTLALLFITFLSQQALASDIKWNSLPSDTTISAGGTLTLSASASGSGTIKYSWRKDGNYLGKTGSTLSIKSVDSSDAGLYQVVASNSTGKNFSRQFEVKVSGSSGGSSTTEPKPSTDTGSLGGSGKAILSWDKPVERENGDKLNWDEIDSYRIYHTNGSGTINRVYETVFWKRDLTLNDLPKGTHYFRISTVDTTGNESQMTGLLTKKIW